MVRKLVERADVLVERSHSFAPLIKDTCNRLDSGFNDFFQKIMRINNKEVCYFIRNKKTTNYFEFFVLFLSRKLIKKLVVKVIQV
jgi:hypothetical protein